MHEPEQLITAAMDAQFTDDLRNRDTSIALLSANGAADGPLRAALERAVRTAAERGWQPEDLRRHLTRFLSPEHAALLAAPGPGERDRLTAISRLIDVLCELRRLPKIAVLTRSAAPAHPSLGRIRALLAKAESTSFPAEAEALVAAAQRLMTRHSLDQAALDASAGVRSSADRSADVSAPSGVRLPVDNPYEEAKATLLHVIAEANRCRAVWQSDLGFSTVLGYPADLEAVELLYTSLLLQADAAMPKNGSKRKFRQSFLTSFAHHIGERLARVGEEEVTDDLLPVLARRDQAVDTAVERLFPAVRSVRGRTIQDLDGWEQGRRAAKEADLT
ncbi:DUF2786 domain-containing protein [Actinocorallia populi]|uniref:DUF2786 domain-containing protein n=1 Tax=Actinocorallia populi TaxID=2079200 RepID=UPI000D0889F7|nr:DUF2786 domain-containing protein [Actinocorallia populi]